MLATAITECWAILTLLPAQVGAVRDFALGIAEVDAPGVYDKLARSLEGASGGAMEGVGGAAAVGAADGPPSPPAPVAAAAATPLPHGPAALLGPWKAFLLEGTGASAPVPLDVWPKALETDAAVLAAAARGTAAAGPY